MSGPTRIIACLLAFLLAVPAAFAQGGCPPNIGFEQGDFTGWTCYTGTVGPFSGVQVFLSSPVPDRHTILKNVIPQEKDLYGGFPVNCPNGSGYSIKLGNNAVAAQAERVSYTFVVPPDKNEYSIIYNYAIVFQNPNHSPEEQPKFTAKVFDQTAGQYLSCGAFEFVASSGLPGFKISSLDNTVYYKPWSPVTLKLMGCAGKTITIEFTVNDCTRGGHFGYAYLDVNENCTSPITGNVYCNGATSLNLQAPFGFASYAWFKGDFSQYLGNGNSLRLDPIPPVGTRFAVEIQPYAGLGCPDTLYTTITKSDQAFNFELADTALECLGVPANLTAPHLTQGSTPGLTLSYHLDSNAIEYLATPAHVTDSGLYYVKAVNSAGCNETQSILLRFNDALLRINDPPATCAPNSVNLSSPAVTAGSEPTFSFTYWKDYTATDPLPDPPVVSNSGTYYIRGSNALCTRLEPVNVKIYTESDLVLHPASDCGQVDITHPDVTAGSLAVFSYSYWRDAAASLPVPDPKNIGVSGDYYVRASLGTGCSFIKPVQVVIKPLPEFTVNHPTPVTAPETTSILNTAIAGQIYQYSYWTNPQATTPLSNPSVIDKTGVYYIKAVDSEGCVTIKQVNVEVKVPFHPVIRYPDVFSPNGDGVNDRFRISVTGNVTFRGLTIFDRWGRAVFKSANHQQYWTGEMNGKPLPAGTYYWIMELVNNNNQDFYRRSGSITIIR